MPKEHKKIDKVLIEAVRVAYGSGAFSFGTASSYACDTMIKMARIPRECPFCIFMIGSDQSAYGYQISRHCGVIYQYT